MRLPQRKIFLFSVPVIGLLICLNPFIRSVELVRSYFNIKSKITSISPEFIASTHRQRSLNYFPDEQQFSRRTVDIITKASDKEDIRINKILPLSVVTDSNLKMATQQIILEGSFISLLKSISAIQRDLEPVKIVCLKFEVVHATNKNPILILNLYFQGIIIQQ